MRWPAARMQSQQSKGFGMYEIAARLRSEGRDVIQLSFGSPFYDTPLHIKAAAKAALDAGVVHYGDLQGTETLRRALAERYRVRYGVNYGAGEILITNGVTQASFAAFMAALDVGDEVILLDPFYPQHISKIELAGARVVAVPMRLEQRTFRLDARAVEAAVTRATRMIVLINPANPTGTVFTRHELEQLAAIVRRHDLLVLSDEVYEFITFDGRTHTCFASLPGMKEHTITVSAFTKAYAMDGWRIGYAAAPPHIIADLRRITLNSTTHPCVFAQEGALAAVRESQDCVRAMVEEDARRRDLVVEALNSMPGVSCGTPEGTIYAFADFSSLGRSSIELSRQILESAHVALESGAFYGKRGEGYLRICFGAESYERLAEGMHRLGAWVAAQEKA